MWMSRFCRRDTSDLEISAHHMMLARWRHADQLIPQSSLTEWQLSASGCFLLVISSFSRTNSILSLMQACKNGLSQHLEHLLFYGADINAETSSHDTPLHICARFDRVCMMINYYYNYYYYIRLVAFSRTTWVSRHQKSKLFWILLEQEMMGWQWHQLDHMQIICSSLQTGNHASASSLKFSVKALKAW